MPITNQDNDVRDAIVIVRQGLGAEHPLLSSNYGSNIIKKLDNAKSVDDVRNALNGSLSGAGRETYSNVLKGLDNIKQGGSIDQLSSAAKAADSILADRPTLEAANNGLDVDVDVDVPSLDKGSTRANERPLSKPKLTHVEQSKFNVAMKEHPEEMARFFKMVDENEKYMQKTGGETEQMKGFRTILAEDEKQKRDVSGGKPAGVQAFNNTPEEAFKRTYSAWSDKEREAFHKYTGTKPNGANLATNRLNANKDKTRPASNIKPLTSVGSHGAPGANKVIATAKFKKETANWTKEQWDAFHKYTGASRIPTGNPPSKACKATDIIPNPSAVRRNTSSGRAI